MITPAELFSILLFILPPYLANSAPILLGGGKPVDLGKRFVDGEPLLGGNKTILGVCSALLVGVLIALMEGLAISEHLIIVGALSSLGAVAGDLLGAFIKRRLRVPPGKPFVPLDQLDFLVGATLLAAPVFQFTIPMLLILYALTPPIHILTNRWAYRLRLKGTFW